MVLHQSGLEKTRSLCRRCQVADFASTSCDPSGIGVRTRIIRFGAVFREARRRPAAHPRQAVAGMGHRHSADLPGTVQVCRSVAILLLRVRRTAMMAV